MRNENKVAKDPLLTPLGHVIRDLQGKSDAAEREAEQRARTHGKDNERVFMLEQRAAAFQEASRIVHYWLVNEGS